MPLIAPDALDLLRCYNWPGNVRQLRNVMRRAFLIAANVVKVDDIRACLPRPPTRIAVPCAPAGDTPLRDLVDQRVREVERDAILDALTRAGGNKAAAARQLGVDYKTFRKKLSAIEQPGAVQHDLASV
jgi:DNA-binding NtrC family response regulator